MSTPVTALLTVGGIAVVAIALRDIFQTLLHTEGRGPLARAVMSMAWNALRRPTRRDALLLAGPLGMLMVVGTWAMLLVLGWALIVWPQLEHGFSAPEGNFWDAVHVSLTSLTTLGFADLEPQHDWLRVIVPMEALLGFGLLSASISYLLLMYPVLARRRSVAHLVSRLRKAEMRDAPLPRRLNPGSAERMYEDLTGQVAAIERDLLNFPTAYYFVERDERFSFAAMAPFLLDLARRGTRPEVPEPVRQQAELLVDALADLARTTADSFPRTRADSIDAIFAAHAHDHLVGH